MRLVCRRKKKCIRFVAGAEGAIEENFEEEDEDRENGLAQDKLDKLKDDGEEEDDDIDTVETDDPVPTTEETPTHKTQPPPLEALPST